MSTSPMIKHYRKVKEEYQDCIIFYRLGDFYEMFFEDAIKVSKMLDLTLTGKNCGEEERAPMCGIPYHAADEYIAKLVSMGEKVAICEQLTEAGGKDLVERDVVRIVTAGTVINNELIDDKTNNYIISVFSSGNSSAIAWADITTGEFYVKQFDGYDVNVILDTIVRINPAEIICNRKVEEDFRDIPLVSRGILPKFYQFIESAYNLNNAESELKKQFNVLTLAGFGLADKKTSISCAGALVSYLKQTQKNSLEIINSIKSETDDDVLILDVNAIRNLELVKTLRDGNRYGSLLWLIDKTKTSMGARKLRKWILAPLTDIDKINYRLDGVESFYKNSVARQGLVNVLGAVRDIGRLTGKISNGNLTPKDCNLLADSLDTIPNIKFQLLGIDSKLVQDVFGDLCDFTELVKLLKSAIIENAPNTTKDGDFINSGFDKNLDELRLFTKDSRKIIDEIENRERERTGIKTLKIKYNRVFGYCIEVTNSFKHLVPYDYIRRQTLLGAERYVTEELKELEPKILSSMDKALKLEQEIFAKIKTVLESEIDKLKMTTEAISELDVILSLAVVAKENGYVRPTILPYGSDYEIIGGRHPVVESLIRQRFVPNDCILDSNENRTMIITGPNMAGKSTYMRQVAIITLMAQIGSFVPCSSAKITLADKIFTRVGASDNLILDQSTFMVEMSEMANILRSATENSLLILDEIGRGTSTYDGLSIAWAVIEYITTKIKAKTLFATHYHELTELEKILNGVKNYKVTVKETVDGIAFLRKVMRGSANRSFGIEVSSLAGISKEITDRAKVILKNLESSDITKKAKVQENIEEVNYSEVETIIKELNLDNVSPMQAFSILMDLKEKLGE